MKVLMTFQKHSPPYIQIDIFIYFVYATLFSICWFNISKTDPKVATSEDKVNPLLTFVADLG